MNVVSRQIETSIKQKVDYKKAIVLLGPRQVGKTTLMEKIATELDTNYLKIDGDDPAIRQTWDNPTKQYLLNLLGSNKVLLIDEAQRIRNIGLSVKMILDAKLKIQVFITGSSALDLASDIKEPLTGRKWEFFLFPFSFNEMKKSTSFLEESLLLNHRLVMGMYPEVVLNKNADKTALIQLAGSYLYKDILEKGGIQRPDVLLKILQALAWQLGNEVSYNEIARLVEVDKNTVINYIDLLEKAFVIFRFSPLTRNLRNEISSNRKIYFYDNGIRNAIINQLAPIESRNDVGVLWENYMISERKKLLAYHDFYGTTYFWRSRTSEIDYIEEIDGSFYSYEFKWNEKSKPRFPDLFLTSYKPKINEVIHRKNYYEWLTKYPY
ncbi:MAG: ATP-binding protein [Saprospiraceae bacterium]